MAGRSLRTRADELIDNLIAPLDFIRDSLAKQYLKMGGRMCDDKGRPKEMDSFVRLAEEKKKLWTSVKFPAVQAYTQRTLAMSLQKLMEVFVRSFLSLAVMSTDELCVYSALNLARSASAVSQTILKSSSTLATASPSASLQTARSRSSSTRWTSKSS